MGSDPADKKPIVTEDTLINTAKLLERATELFTPEQWKDWQEKDKLINDKHDLVLQWGAPDDDDLGLDFLWDMFKIFKNFLRYNYEDMKKNAAILRENAKEILEFFQAHQATA